MFVIQPQIPSLYRNLTFENGKCKKNGVVVILTDIGKANERDIEDINAVDPRLLAGSNTAIGFDLKIIYIISIDDKLVHQILILEIR